jgi:serine/threonine protein kinase
MEAVEDTKSTAEGPTRCLDDSTVLRFVSGQLDDASRRLVEDELGRCRACAALVAALIRGSGSLHIEPADLDGAGPAPAEGRGEGLARYVLGPEIARGGMGTILAAFDRRLSRSVAVKRMDGSARSLVERFRREIRVTASLQHPGIVPIYDAGVLEDGQPFYAMRHVPGASLEQAVAECEDGKRLGLLVPVLAAAEAVAYAHTRGIIHRDLKPSNILVGPFGETVVIDWGLAGIDQTHDPGSDPAELDPRTTSQGSVLGTPRFMAPEQARGEPATPESDVYALGGILYHALSGVPPVPDGTVSHVLERVARADVRPLRDVAPGLPGDLVAIVERAMALAPEAR